LKILLSLLRWMPSDNEIRCILTISLYVIPMLLLLAPFVCINSTSSEPQGIWLSLPFWLAGKPAVGRTVIVCAPPRALHLAAYYEAHLPPPKANGCRMLFKTVWAIPGQHVESSASGVTVDGQPIADSFSALHLKPITTTVPPTQIFGGSIMPWSYDSRVYGTVRPIAIAIPLLVDPRWSVVVKRFDATHRPKKPESMPNLYKTSSHIL
jgi:type IV secretory pathway protease TraF